MRTTDVTVIGAGPAGLAAATECARAGADVLLIDASRQVGGQLVRQTHKFFGSSAHMAGSRGIDIARRLGKEAKESGVQIWIDSAVHNLTPTGEIHVVQDRLACAEKPDAVKTRQVSARRIILATGAREKSIAFPGWTLPGVMGAGAAQTMINLHRVLPGRRVLMVGSGNVGLIVTYQLLQAGAEVAAVVEAACDIGGYQVHAAKVRRAGVPILTSQAIHSARGRREVVGATAVELDGQGNARPNTRRSFSVDTVCIAVGLRPEIRLARMAGCRLIFCPPLGGWTPIHTEHMCVAPRVYAAGDICGVEEASTAMEEGRLAGMAASASLGLVTDERLRRRTGQIQSRLQQLRGATFSRRRRRSKQRLIRQGTEEWATADWRIYCSRRPKEPAIPVQAGKNSAQLPAPAEEDKSLRDDTIICRCEEVTAGEIRTAISRGARTVSAVKRRTRAGMGLCQGRTCEMLVARLLSQATRQPADVFAVDHRRPPVVPVTFGALAGDSHDSS